MRAPVGRAAALRQSCFCALVGIGTLMMRLHSGHGPCLPARLSGTFRPFWHFGHLILIGIATRPCAWSWGGVVKANCTAPALRLATVQYSGVGRAQLKPPVAAAPGSRRIP